MQGARPLFFLDYVGDRALSTRTSPSRSSTGVAAGCRENGCALLGGETAEMPGFYAAGEYDLAGFIVGVVERGRSRSTARASRPGDVLIGAALHRPAHQRLLAGAADRLRAARSSRSTDTIAELGETVGEALLAPHRSYLAAVEPLLDADLRHGLAHITGGGITDNLPRVFPQGAGAVIDAGAWEVPPIFRFLERAGEVPDDEMYRVFNMGIGMVVVCRAGDADRARRCRRLPASAARRVIGEIVEGDGVSARVEAGTVPARGHADERALGVLISGRGSNLQAIIDAIGDGRLDARIAVVISQPRRGARARPGAGAGIETLVLPHRGYPGREDYDGALVAELQARGVGLVCLAGFMRLLGPALRRRLSERHPEHPPVAAAGVPRPRRAAPGVGARRQGQRLHRAPRRRPNSTRARSSLQAAVPVLDDDTPESLSARILVEEHRLYPEAIRIVLDGGWRIDGRRFVAAYARRPADRTRRDPIRPGRRSVAQREHGHFWRAVDADRAEDRPDSARHEDRRGARGAEPGDDGNRAAAGAPTSGRTTWPPCVWPDRTRGMFQRGGLPEAPRVVREQDREPRRTPEDPLDVAAPSSSSSGRPRGRSPRRPPRAGSARRGAPWTPRAAKAAPPARSGSWLPRTAKTPRGADRMRQGLGAGADVVAVCRASRSRRRGR